MNSELYAEIGRLAKKWRKYPNTVDKSDPNNKDILIEKNARLAVDTALRYRGLGLEDDELISAAFEGLVLAYQKYDDTKAVVRDRILSQLNEDTSSEEFLKIVEGNLKYGDVCKFFSGGIPTTYEDMQKWVRNHIRPAKFSSVAYFWCKAMVLSEIERVAKPLRVAESYRVDNQFVSIDDDDVYVSDKIKYTETNPEEVEEAYQKLYEGIPDLCLKILFLRHGIGCDEPFTLREIADRYGRNVGEIKNILSSVEDRMRDNIRRYKLKINDLLG